MKTVPTLFGATTKSDVVTILVGQKKCSAQFLGKGRFSAAFNKINRATERPTTTVFLYTFFGDKTKDILVRAKENHRVQHLPRLEKLDDQAINGKYVAQVYKTRMYNPWDNRKASVANLRDIVEFGKVLMAQTKKLYKEYDNYEDAEEAFAYLHNSVKPFNSAVVRESKNVVSPSLHRTLKAIVKEAAKTPGTYMLDGFSERNLALTGAGHLILLDPVFPFHIINNHHIGDTQK